MNKQSLLSINRLYLSISIIHLAFFLISPSSLPSRSLHLALVPMRPTAVIGPLRTFAEASPKDFSIPSIPLEARGKEKARERVAVVDGRKFYCKLSVHKPARWWRAWKWKTWTIVVKHDIIPSAPAPWPRDIYKCGEKRILINGKFKRNFSSLTFIHIFIWIFFLSLCLSN